MPVRAVYLDECIDVRLADAFRFRGIEVVTTRAASRLGANDDSQFLYAAEQGLLMLTHNGRHYRRLHRAVLTEGKSHGGVAILPQTSPSRTLVRTTLLVDWIGTFDECGSRLFTWGMLQELLEQGFRLPGYTEQDVQLALGRG
jgi:hypothetical protein